MTVSVTIPRDEYLGDNIQTQFSYTFLILAKTDIKVLVDNVQLTVDTDFTVTNIGVDGGGIVDFAGGASPYGAPISGADVVFLRITAQNQNLDLVENDPFSASSVEGAFDKNILISQEQEEKLARAVLSGEGIVGTIDMTFPAPAANLPIVWNATADGLVNGSAIPATTTDLAEGTNLYYTEARVTANPTVSGHVSNTSNPHSVTAAQLGALQNVVEDTSPQLGGNLDLNGYSLSSSVGGAVINDSLTVNGPTLVNNNAQVNGNLQMGGNAEFIAGSSSINQNIPNQDMQINHNGTGKIVISGQKFPNTDGVAGQTLTTDGAGVLSWSTPAGGGDMLQATYDPTAIGLDAFARANHTGTQTASTISDFDTGVSNNSTVTALVTKTDFITVTQAVNLDTIESDTTANNAKVTNATHTGEVTGSNALAVNPTSITNKPTATAVAGDFLLFSDTSDAGNLKKVDATDLLGGGGGGALNDLTDVTDTARTTGDTLIFNGTIWIPLKNNYGASTAPTQNNDNTQGYAIGSTWIDLTTDISYICSDAATGFATWTAIGNGTPPPNPNRSIILDGANDNITASTSVGGTGLSQWTVQGWVKPTSVTFNQHLFSFYLSNSSGIGPRINSTGNITNNFGFTSNYLAVAGVWQFFAFTYTAGAWNMYYSAGLGNTTLDTNAPFNVTHAHDASCLPQVGNNVSTQFFGGLMDDVRFYDVVRTQGQIDADKDTQLANPLTVPNLRYYYKMNDDTDLSTTTIIEEITGSGVNSGFGAGIDFSSDTPF